ncbi:alpha/beta hydrolase [Paraburkholderia sp. Cpub6]|uniref:alpha/beta hydrolase n=1 Tax=Paraburkholderia sp. Cpub6 TaxID=2723094 RepID=UPI00160DA1FF|nr:phospholipase [Paraburkholderia sp. Cpub6]MBB5462308.1 phospholipase/carboxylesterase [Paraburkholderia sp. Cpub6]
MDILQRDEASGLSFRVVPASEQPLGRLFLLHGVGGNETNLMPLAVDLPKQLELVFVRSQFTLAHGQYAWFQVHFGANGPVINADQANDSRMRLHQLVQSLSKRDGAAPMPALMAGFSQGGILSASVALSAPEDVARFAILSGRILPELEPHLASREALKQTAGFIAHGEYDDKLRVAFANHADRRLTELGVQHETHIYPIGHSLNADVVRDFSSWLSRQIEI